MLKVNKSIVYYEFRFSHLSTAKSGNKVAPHKPLLLLSVIDLIETGIIISRIIELSDALVESFKRNANIYASGIEYFKPNIGMPFFYMRSEPFWELIPKDDGVTPVANTIPSLRKHYTHARIDDELFQLLQDPATAQSLRRVLIETYLTK